MEIQPTPRTLLAPQAILDRIRAHGAETYPYECCGVLLGTDHGDERIVVETLPLPNIKEEMRERRYVIDPRDLLRAEREARARGLDLLGIYHSHPDHPARPSEFDREHAWPWYSYVIVAVREGVASNLRSWELREDRSAFAEERLVERESPFSGTEEPLPGNPGGAA